jgi:replicative DNA helicase
MTSQENLNQTGPQTRRTDPNILVPPQDLGAEEAVIGGLLIRREAIGEALQTVSAEHFFSPRHRIIFDALVDLYERNSEIDPIVLRDELSRRGQLDEAGGTAFMIEAMDRVPEASNVRFYCEIVRNKAMLRELIRVSSQIRLNAYADKGDTDEFLDQAEQQIFEVTQRRVTGRPDHIRQILEIAYKQIQQRDEGIYTGATTGFLELDDLTGGLQNTEMIIVAARPSMGKTAFALNIAEHIGVDLKRPVAFFSMEMSKQAVGQRMLCSRGDVDSHKLRRGRLSDQEIMHLGLVCGELQEAPVFIDDTSSLTVLEVRAKARQLKLQHDISCVFVDYLQLMRMPGAASREQEISGISRGLKAMARELDLPVVTLSQLNRSPEGREGHRPRISDLRESGAIEQDADVVLLLHRPEYYDRQNEDLRGLAEVNVAKQRNGPTGEIKLQFNESRTQFHNLSMADMAESTPF